MKARRKFDEQYYQKFYLDPLTRAMHPEDFDKLGNFVCGYLHYLEQPVAKVLDMGCGLGLWHNVVERHFPDAVYTGVEISDYVCERYGWHKGSVVDWSARSTFDLVICSDVVQYLNDEDTESAIENLSSLCEGVLYFAALTERDWRENCDQARTDPAGYLRTGEWYRERLGRHFTNIGGGLFAAEDSPTVRYELEEL